MKAAARPIVDKVTYVGGLTTAFVAAFILLASAVSKRGPPAETPLMAAYAVLLLAGVLLATLFYKMWAAIQDGRARTTPGKALGLLVVPFYNFYWGFQAIPGWAEDYNAFIVRHSIAARPIGVRLFRAYVVLCLLSLVPLFGPLACFVNLFVTVAMAIRICDALNAIAHRTSSGSIRALSEQAGRLESANNTTGSGSLTAVGEKHDVT